MAPTKIVDPQITKELYKKNLELVTANQSLRLQHLLYQVIVSTLTISEASQQIIDIITRELKFKAGIVFIKSSGQPHLKVAASTDSKANQLISDIINQPLSKITLPLSTPKNSVIETYHQDSKRTTHSLAHLLHPYLTPASLQSSLLLNNLTAITYPISFATNKYGCFTALSQRSTQDLTSHEKLILNRSAFVFGIAINRIALYHDLKKANRQLRHLDKLKDEFVYIATHELKTPVAVMKGYLSMIQDGSYGKLPPKFKKPISQLSSANAQLIQLVNDLLEIARAESHTINIATKPVDLTQTVTNTFSSLQTLADQKQLKLAHQTLQSPLNVKADPDRLKEILNNLISNAIKYSDSGTITVSHVNDTHHVVTHIADQGLGISPADQKRIFTRFFRAEDQANKVTGTGLGLFIVKQLVEKMGGKIWFSSQLGKGTTFSFSLPKV